MGMGRLRRAWRDFDLKPWLLTDVVILLALVGCSPAPPLDEAMRGCIAYYEQARGHTPEQARALCR